MQLPIHEQQMADLAWIAGIPMEALQGSRTCVFVGSFVKGTSPEFSE